MIAAAPLFGPAGMPVTPTAVDFAAIAGAGRAMLPDFDHRHATIAHSLGPITKALAIAVEKVSGDHRHGTHSFIVEPSSRVATSSRCGRGRGQRDDARP